MGEPLYVFKQQVRDLAANIYVGLIGQSVSVSDSSVKMTTSAENLAKLSFKLAQAFQGVEDELNASNLPKNPGFKLEASDIAEWDK
jgi:hypothetical protein